MLDLNQAQLAELAQVGVVTIRQFEAGNAEPRRATLAAIRAALEAAGVEFIPENGGGAGVRLRKEAPAVTYQSLPFKAAPGYFVRVTWPDGRTMDIDNFVSEAEADKWITEKSAEWFRLYYAKR